MNRIFNYLRSLLLIELMQGMAVTFRYFWKPKYTVRYPMEKIPQSNRFRGLHALRRSKWYSWMLVSTIESTGQLSSQKPQ